MTTRSEALTDVRTIPPIDHDEAMALAGTESARLLDLVQSLTDDEWLRPTECPGWRVRDVLGHLLGMWKLQIDEDLRKQQIAATRAAVQGTDRIWLDELTGRQVQEHAALPTDELATQLRTTAPIALAARASMPEEFRRLPYEVSLPGETGWTFGYLFDVIHTRDPWMHRVDIARAVGRPLHLTSDHDGRLVADVVREWSQRHNAAFTLTLTGPAGGCYTAGESGESHELDAVEFCRILSGRANATGLLRVAVPF